MLWSMQKEMKELSEVWITGRLFELDVTEMQTQVGWGGVGWGGVGWGGVGCHNNLGVCWMGITGTGVLS